MEDMIIYPKNDIKVVGDYVRQMIPGKTDELYLGDALKMLDRDYASYYIYNPSGSYKVAIPSTITSIDQIICIMAAGCNSSTSSSNPTNFYFWVPTLNNVYRKMSDGSIDLAVVGMTKTHSYYGNFGMCFPSVSGKEIQGWDTYNNNATDYYANLFRVDLAAHTVSLMTVGQAKNMTVDSETGKITKTDNLNWDYFASNCPFFIMYRK